MTGSLAELVTRCLELKADAMAEMDYLTQVVVETTKAGSLHDARAAAVVYELAALALQIDRLTSAVRLTQVLADAAEVTAS